MYKTTDFNYNLPEELIAQIPIEPRDNSRLLVYEKDSGAVFDKRFYDIESYLQPGDVLVVNNTRVLPARLFAHTLSGGKIELLLLRQKSLNDWEVMVKPGRKARVGALLTVSENLSAQVLSTAENGGRIVRFFYDGVFADVLSKCGNVPLPPYIKQELKDKERYQTVYAKTQGSSAAPTAGLHFTNALLEKIKARGVTVAELLLHVGPGTFRPVKSEFISDHSMHSEYYEVSQAAADIINAAKRQNRRIIAVGTTAVRTLESAADEGGYITECKGDTSIFIYPPYKFKCVDALITNFHLPQSTLLMLVSAFAGRQKTLELYAYAVENKYRFFSFGDAMFIY